MQARDLMNSPPVACHVNDMLNVAAQKMWEFDVGALAVVNDEGTVTGMITDRDICMAAYTQAKPLDELLVNSAMAKHVVTAHPDTTVAALERLMASRHIRRIPIVDREGKPVGVVSMTDLSRKPKGKAA